MRRFPNYAHVAAHVIYPFEGLDARAVGLGEGVSVKVVSKMLHVDSSFVTTQSKMLEKKGFVRRKTSAEDARIVEMSLTDKSYKHMANLASQQEDLNEFIFAEFSDRELTEFTGKLASLKNRLEKACLKVAMDI
jgi:DNA-binding MarR family transcriptional regulator